MIPCTIVGVVQRIDFETNLSQSFAVIRLDGGQVFEAAISPESAQLLVEEQVGGAGMPGQEVRVPAPEKRASAPAAPAFVPTAANVAEPAFFEKQTSDEDVHYFGGPDTLAPAYTAPEQEPEPAPEPASDVLMTPAPSRPLPPPEYDPRAKEKNFKRGEFISDAPRRTVPMDSFGYPMTNFQGVDPTTITRGDKDEDGVGSF